MKHVSLIITNVFEVIAFLESFSLAILIGSQRGARTCPELTDFNKKLQKGLLRRSSANSTIPKAHVQPLEVTHQTRH